MRKSIIYDSLEHARFFYKMLEKCKGKDTYYQSLIYCLGICRETRDHISEIYDFESGFVKTACLRAGWQTSGSMQVTRLAMNLYCDCMPSVDDVENEIKEAEYYAPSAIFACEYAIYFWQAIKLRYPEYCSKNENDFT